MEIDKSSNFNLDIIRCLAAYMVLFCHLGQYCGLSVTDEMRKGVQLFFILSGYLIFNSLNHTSSLGQYYRKRFLRIVPVYWLVLVINYIMGGGWFIFIDREPIGFLFSNEGPLGIKYLRYFFFLHMFIPSENYGYWNNAYAVWTMSSFAFFYLVAPFLYKLINRFSKALFLLCILMVLRPFVQKLMLSYLFTVMEKSEQLIWFVNNTPINTIYCFIFGCTAYLALKEKRLSLYGIYLTFIAIMGKMQWYTYEIVVCMLFIIILCCPLEVKNIFIQKCIRLLSNASFSLYLIHPVTLQYMNFFMLKVLKDSRICNILRLIVLLSSAIIISINFWKFIEYPLENWLFSRFIKQGDKNDIGHKLCK